MNKYCKQCGKEIPQNSKEDSCENCQNKKNKIKRRILEGAVGVAGTVISIGLFVITRGKFSGPKT
jgi:uncharacterized membrane protein YvbJ